MMPLAETAVWIAAGIALGAAYMWLLGRTVAAMTPPAGKGAAAGYLALRLLLAAAVLGFAATRGALPLLLVLAGFLVARTVAIRRVKETGDGR